MKKTKIAAIVACAALLVLGMAFTAMAANKWVFQDGGWYAVDKDGDVVSGWVKGEDGVQYWADDDGLWVTDAWVGENEDIYVGADGKKANGWLKLANGEDDVETYGDYSWYYFAAGKVTKNSNSKAKLIGDARYCFDSTGRMVYGWVKADGTDFTSVDPDEDGIDGSVYYCGGEDEGWAQTGWLYLYAPDGDADETEYYWFYGNPSTGKLTKPEDNSIELKKTIDKEKYTFDEDGRMLTGWVPSDASAASASYALESGLGVEKNWVWAVPTDKMIKAGGYEDEVAHWFWVKKKGVLGKGEFTTAKTSKTYWALDPNGVMLSGLYNFGTPATGKTKAQTAAAILEASNSFAVTTSYPAVLATYGSAIADVDDVTAVPGDVYFYFGEEVSDGSMKTGAQTVVIDGETVEMRFSKGKKDKFYGVTVGNTIESKWFIEGASVYGYQGGKYYIAGQALAGTEDDLMIVTIDAVDKNAVIPNIKEDASGFVAADLATLLANAPGKKAITNKDDEITGYTFADDCGFGLVKADGTIVRKCSALKDADGNKYTVKNGSITKVVLAD